MTIKKVNLKTYIGENEKFTRMTVMKCHFVIKGVMLKMVTKEIVTEVVAQGGEIWVEDGRLKLRTAKLSPDLEELIREKKELIKTYLTMCPILDKEDYMELLRGIFRIAQRIASGEKELMPEYDKLVMMLQLHQGVI
jgi:hypothetical protein